MRNFLNLEKILILNLIMIALRFFFRSWYGNVLILMLLAATSSFLITFYTTALSVPWSITLEKHLMIFLFSFVLMFVAIFLISYVIYRLDANSYLRQHELLRYIIQFILLVLLLGAVALRVVYAVYWTFFRVDLQKAEYFERDYVVVMFCLIMVQVYYFIRKERRVKAFDLKRFMIMEKWFMKKEEDLENEIQKNKTLQNLLHDAQVEQERLIMLYEERIDEVIVQKQLRLDAVQQEKKTLILKHESEMNELKLRKQLLRMSHEQLSDGDRRSRLFIQQISKTLSIIIGVENVKVRITQVAYFYLKKGSSSFKMVDVKLLDGREGRIDIESLAKIEKLWPDLLFRSSRGRLIQLLAIKDFFKKDDVFIIELYGAEQENCKVLSDVYDKLLKINEEWTIYENAEQ